MCVCEIIYSIYLRNIHVLYSCIHGNKLLYVVVLYSLISSESSDSNGSSTTAYKRTAKAT